MTSRNPWAVALLIFLILLSAVQYWREATDPNTFSILKGSLPNLLAVPVLWSGIMMFRFSTVEEDEPIADTKANLRRWFWNSLFLSATITVSWEFMQLTGNLVFDPFDLLFTGFGVLVVFVLHRILAPLHLRSREASQSSAD